MLKTDRIEDFETIADEIGVSLDDLLEIASNLDDMETAELIAAIAGVIREKSAALDLIFQELVGGETNGD